MNPLYMLFVRFLLWVNRRRLTPLRWLDGMRLLLVVQGIWLGLILHFTTVPAYDAATYALIAVTMFVSVYVAVNLWGHSRQGRRRYFSYFFWAVVIFAHFLTLSLHLGGAILSRWYPWAMEVGFWAGIAVGFAQPFFYTAKLYRHPDRRVIPPSRPLDWPRYVHIALQSYRKSRWF